MILRIAEARCQVLLVAPHLHLHLLTRLEVTYLKVHVLVADIATVLEAPTVVMAVRHTTIGSRRKLTRPNRPNLIIRTILTIRVGMSHKTKTVHQRSPMTHLLLPKTLQTGNFHARIAELLLHLCGDEMRAVILSVMLVVSCTTSHIFLRPY